MKRRLLLAAGGMALAFPTCAQDRPRRVGVLIDGSPPHPLPEALCTRAAVIALARRAADLLDRVMRGARPGELPSVYELVLNRGTAPVARRRRAAIGAGPGRRGGRVRPGIALAPIALALAGPAGRPSVRA